MRKNQEPETLQIRVIRFLIREIRYSIIRSICVLSTLQTDRLPARTIDVGVYRLYPCIWVEKSAYEKKLFYCSHRYGSFLWQRFPYLGC